MSGMKKKFFLKKLSHCAFMGAGYLLLVILVTHPLIKYLDTRIVGYLFQGKGDLINTVNIYWWTQQLVKYSFYDHGFNPIDLAGALMKIPFKMGVWNVLDVFLFALPLNGIFGFPAYYNLEIILILTLNALSVYLLIHYKTRNKIYAFAGGFIGAINPFTMREISLGRPIQATVFFTALFILATYLYLEKSNNFRVTALAFLWLAAGLYYWFNVIFFGFIFIIMLLFHLFIFKRKIALRSLGILILILFAGVFATSGRYFLHVFENPAVMPTRPFAPFPTLEQIKTMGIPDFDAMRPVNPALIVARSIPLFSVFRFDGLFPVAVIFAVFLVLLINPRKNQEMLATGTLFAILCLGPYLKIGNEVLDAPLPYKFFFQYVPFFSRFYFPYQLVPYATIPLLLFIFSQLKQVKEKVYRKKVVPALIGIACIITVFQLFTADYLPLPISKIEISRFYTEAENLPPGGIIELPYPDEKMGIIDFYQVFHRRPVMGNRRYYAPYMGRPDLLELLKQEKNRKNTFLEFVASARKGKVNESFTTADARRIKNLGFSWIVVHRYRLNNPDYPFPQFENVCSVLEKHLGEPYYSDRYLVVFRL